MPTPTQQETNLGLLAILGYTLDFRGRVASVDREYRGWCAGMQRATNKRFPRTSKQGRKTQMALLAANIEQAQTVAA